MAKMEHTSERKPGVVLEPVPVQIGHTEMRHSINKAQGTGVNQSNGERTLSETTSSRMCDEHHALARVQVFSMIDTRGQVLSNVVQRRLEDYLKVRDCMTGAMVACAVCV